MATETKKSKKPPPGPSGADAAAMGPSSLPPRSPPPSESPTTESPTTEASRRLPGQRGPDKAPRKKPGQAAPKKELPASQEELSKLTAGLKPFARPVVYAYDELMKYVSDMALDDYERQMGEETVAALMWYYGLTHPITMAALFVGGTTLRRAPKIRQKVAERRAAKQPSAQLRSLPTPPKPDEPKPEAKS